MFVDLLLSGWLRENEHEKLPLDICKVIKWCYYDTISAFPSYSIRCHKIIHSPSYPQSRYLSYQTSNGRCRQSYKTYQESQFRFIPLDSTQATFKIQNVYPDQRFSEYICVHKHHGDKLGLHVNCNNNDASIFKLEMIHNETDYIRYKIKYIDENKKEYCIGTENENYEYNQLYPIEKDEADTCTKRQIYRDLNPANERTSYQYISIYSHTSNRYISFHDYSKFVRESYTKREDSQFAIIPVDESNAAQQLYYIRNIWMGDSSSSSNDRYNLWIGFEVDDDKGNTRKLRLYKPDKRRAIFEFVEHNDHPKQFHIYVYEGQYANGGWLGSKHYWNVLYNDKSKANVYGISIYNNDDYLFAYCLIEIDKNERDIYTIYSHRVKRYFSYQTATAKCREIYDQTRDSQFNLIPVNDLDKDLYYIRNRYADERVNYWLGFEKDENDTLSVRIYESEQKKAIWRLVTTKAGLKDFGDDVDGSTDVKIFGYYKDQEHCGWLCSLADGNWNYLSPNETDAFVYSYRMFSTPICD